MHLSGKALARIDKRPLRQTATIGKRQPSQTRAALAQSVEHIIRNDGVRCSNHLSGTIFPLKIKGFIWFFGTNLTQFVV